MPYPEPISGEKWLADEIKRLIELGQTWTRNKDRVWGVLQLPIGGIVIDGPLVLPLRTILAGSSPFVRRPPDVTVSQKFPLGETAIKFEWSRSQGAFSQGLSNVVIDCKGRANGVEIRGDQESFYDGITITRSRDFGVWAQTLSHGPIVSRLSVEHSPHGIGLKIGASGKPTTAVTIIGASFNQVEVGIERFECYTVDDIGTSFENTPILYSTSRSEDCSSRFHAMLTGRLGSQVARIDGGHKISGTVRKAHLDEVKVNDDILTTKGKSNRPKPVKWPNEKVSI